MQGVEADVDVVVVVCAEMSMAVVDASTKTVMLVGLVAG